MFIDKVNYALILIFIWCLLWFVYDNFVKIFGLKDIISIKLLELPQYLKCYPFDTILNRNCHKDDITLYPFVHVIIYITVGFFVPNHYFITLFVSILFELYEFLIGKPSNIIRDSLFNMIGYIIGSYIANNNKSIKLKKLKKQIIKLFNKIPILISTSILIILLTIMYIRYKHLHSLKR